MVKNLPSTALSSGPNSQAPVISKRRAAEAKASRLERPASSLPASSLPASLGAFDGDGGAGFVSTKDDKRRMKRSTFVSRIERVSSGNRGGGGIRKSMDSNSKRRRPSKKLVATLESLADALPEGVEGGGGGGAAATGREAGLGAGNGGVRTIRHRSLRSRPGAMKKKARLEAMEKERFRLNLAQMAAGTTADGMGSTTAAAATTTTTTATTASATTTVAPETTATASSDRWKALRSFIGATLDKGPQR